MEYNMIFSGFGGQGVLLAGQLVAEAGMKNDKNVSWMPSYGPEMRGGAANCSVIVSDDAIGAPIIANPDILVAMNKPSLDLFQDKVKPGGYLIYNSSLIKETPSRSDITIIPLPANDIANELGVAKVGNMPILGVIIKITDFFTINDIEEVMFKKFGESKKELINLNMKAVEMGMDVVEKLGLTNE